MYVATMGPPGGGRTFITPRFLRWFNIISVTELYKEAMMGIFPCILKHVFEKSVFVLLKTKQIRPGRYHTVYLRTSEGVFRLGSFMVLSLLFCSHKVLYTVV